MTKQEIELKKTELKKQIEELKKKENYYNALQMGLKLLLNGTYGAFGNLFFVLSNSDIAGGITAMGRNLIQYIDKWNQYYWYVMWPDDTRVHEALGLKEKPKPIDQSWIRTDTMDVIDPSEYDKAQFMEMVMEGDINRKVPVSVYADTDSLFVGFAPGMASCGWTGDPMDFVRIVTDERLQPFFKEKLDAYAEKFKVKNIQDFELERVNGSMIFLGKKVYVQNVRWEDGNAFNEMEYLFAKGAGLVKSSTPKFAREKVYEIVRYLLANPNEFNVRDVIIFVKDIKKQFELADIEDISLKISCNNYEKVVLSDKDTLDFVKGAHYAVKAAALHNYILNDNPEYMGKYEFIKSGTKIYYYYCKHHLNDAYGYIGGMYPKEIAPPVDYDVMFEKVILNQVNAFVKAVGLPELNRRLRVIMPLFERASA